MKSSTSMGRRLGSFLMSIVTGALPSIIAILAGFLLGFIILLCVNPSQALAGIWMILKGGLTTGASGMGQVLYYTIPIMMTGLSVGFAFKTGLFNIGASGQFMMGAFAAIFAGIKWTFLPSGIHWIAAILAGMVAGAIWGMIPGILKALCNVNEVITCIMTNYIGMSLVNFLIKTIPGLYNGTTNKTVQVDSSAVIPKWGLTKLLPYNSLNAGIIIAIFFGILMYIILNKTTFGYELKACGYNKDASKYAGISAKRNIVLSMVIAGALAGIGGAMLYLSGSGLYYSVVDIVADEGFDGISIALLGMSHPIGIIFSSVFISHIQVGGFNLQLLKYDNEIIDIIIASIIYFSAFSLVFSNILSKLLKGRGGRSKNANAEPDTPIPAPNVAANLNDPVNAESTSDESKGGDDQ